MKRRTKGHMLKLTSLFVRLKKLTLNYSNGGSVDPYLFFFLIVSSEVRLQGGAALNRGKQKKKEQLRIFLSDISALRRRFNKHGQKCG